MAKIKQSIHGQWSSRLAFIMAATGSAVGLGNIWKFPYIAGENGGGAFVLFYLLCIVLIGIPIMMAEVMLGRRGRQSPINTMRELAHEESRHGFWQIVGWGGVLAGFLILSYYSVIAGWAMAYVLKAFSGAFTGIGGEQSKALFGGFTKDAYAVGFWHTVFITITMIVVARGVRHGLEKAVRYLMPALLVLLLVLVGYAMSTDGFVAGLKFLFAPDFSKLSGDAMLEAMGHAFFTLSLGMGAIMIYGSYLPKNVSIAKTTFYVAGADTMVALLAGMAIFPLVFTYGLKSGAGPSLIFQTLPIAFGNMPGGVVLAGLFFILLVFAAWTSSISLIEPAVAWLVENRGMKRITASLWTGVVTWLVGFATVFSFNIWSDIKPLSGLATFEKFTLFDLLDYLTSNIMLPLGGFLIAIFAGWLMSRKSSREELLIKFPYGYPAWLFLVRFVAPSAVVIVFMVKTGLWVWLKKFFETPVAVQILKEIKIFF